MPDNIFANKQYKNDVAFMPDFSQKTTFVTKTTREKEFFEKPEFTESNRYKRFTKQIIEILNTNPMVNRLKYRYFNGEDFYNGSEMRGIIMYQLVCDYHDVVFDMVNDLEKEGRLVAGAKEIITQSFKDLKFPTLHIEPEWGVLNRKIVSMEIRMLYHMISSAEFDAEIPFDAISLKDLMDCIWDGAMAISTESTYNAMLESALYSASISYLMLKHRDLELTDSNWFIKVTEALQDYSEQAKMLMLLFDNIYEWVHCFVVEMLWFRVLPDIKKAKDLSAVLEEKDITIKRLEEDNQNLKNSVKNKKSSNEEYLANKLKEAEKQIENLKKEKEQTEKENVRLKEYFEELNDDDTDDENEVEDIELSEADIATLKNKKIIFARSDNQAGYEIMTSLAETFPNAKFINGVAIDTNFNRYDYVVILAKYIKHGPYWKVRDTAKESSATCVHTHKSSLQGIMSDMIKAERGKLHYTGRSN